MHSCSGTNSLFVVATQKLMTQASCRTCSQKPKLAEWNSGNFLSGVQNLPFKSMATVLKTVPDAESVLDRCFGLELCYWYASCDTNDLQSICRPSLFATLPNIGLRSAKCLVTTSRKIGRPAGCTLAQVHWPCTSAAESWESHALSLPAIPLKGAQVWASDRRKLTANGICRKAHQSPPEHHLAS